MSSPVGSGKTALMYQLAKHLSKERHMNIACVTNDIFTQEDAEFLIRHRALDDPGRIRAIETGGCPHAAIREDIAVNLAALEELHARFQTELLLMESGGDNLAANYSRELADYIIYGTVKIIIITGWCCICNDITLVIDVAGGDKVPRKGGPGITQSDLLVWTILFTWCTFQFNFINTSSF